MMFSCHARVPAKIRSKIIQNEFVEFGSLLVNPAFEDKFRITLQPSQEGSSPSLALEPVNKAKRITSIDVWLQAFHVYVGIFTAQSPHEAPGLMKYGATIKDLFVTGFLRHCCRFHFSLCCHHQSYRPSLDNLRRVAWVNLFNALLCKREAAIIVFFKGVVFCYIFLTTIRHLNLRMPKALSTTHLKSLKLRLNFLYLGVKGLDLCLIDRSVKNRTSDLFDYTCTCKADLAAITETWLTTDDAVLRAELCYCDSLSVRGIEAGEKESFEYSEWTISSPSLNLRLVLLYRPPYAADHSLN